MELCFLFTILKRLCWISVDVNTSQLSDNNLQMNLLWKDLHFCGMSHHPGSGLSASHLNALLPKWSPIFFGVKISLLLAYLQIIHRRALCSVFYVPVVHLWNFQEIQTKTLLTVLCPVLWFSRLLTSKMK